VGNIAFFMPRYKGKVSLVKEQYMGEKSKGSVNKKKPAAKSLKEKRAAKQEKKASKSNQG
jgi:hypothetical protein